MKNISLIFKFIFTFLCIALWTNCHDIQTEKIILVPGDSATAARYFNDTNRAVLVVRRDTSASDIFIYGRNWAPNTKGESPVKFYLDTNSIQISKIEFYKDGTFLAKLPKIFSMGSYHVRAVQQNMKGDKKQASVHLVVTSRDAD